jgi:hypothetical protein
MFPHERIHALIVAAAFGYPEYSDNLAAENAHSQTGSQIVTNFIREVKCRTGR